MPGPLGLHPRHRGHEEGNGSHDRKFATHVIPPPTELAGVAWALLLKAGRG